MPAKEVFTNGDVLCILEYVRAASEKLGPDEKKILRKLHLTSKEWTGVLRRFARA